MTKITEDSKKEHDPFMEYFNGDYERFVRDEELKNENFDFELMEQIVALAKSPDVQDRLHSLDLIEDSSNKCPDGFVANLLIALKKDPAHQICTKVKYINHKRNLENIKAASRTMGDSVTKYSSAFKLLSSDIHAISTAFSESQGIASHLADIIDQPVKLIDPKIFEGYTKSLLNIPPITVQMGIGDAMSPITSIGNQMEDTLSPLTSIANQMEDALSPLASIANQMEDALSPLASIANQMEDTESPLTSIGNQMSLVDTASPITAINQIISPVLTQDFPELTISEALGKSSSEIANDLEEISTADEDSIFNFEAYKLLFTMERFLRDMIHERICLKYKKSIEDKIHPQNLKKWGDRQRSEEKNIHMKKGYRLIDYSDFGDLKRIFEKGRNKKEFNDLFNDQEFGRLISKLDELDPIRNKIAHSRSLSKSEFDRLQMYADDITKMLTPMEDANNYQYR